MVIVFSIHHMITYGYGAIGVYKKYGFMKISIA